MKQDQEQRLAAAKDTLLTIYEGMVRAQERYETALKQLEAYNYSTTEEAQAGYGKLLKEIPLLETKLNNLLNQVEGVISETENNTGPIQGRRPLVGGQRGR